MLRAQRFAPALHHRPYKGACGTIQQLRFYTPIWKPDAARDHVAPLRDEDEQRALWSNTGPIASVENAVAAWIRFGNDPVLHSALPVMLGGRYLEHQQRHKETPLPLSNSPFAYVEDYMGTNLVFGSAAHVTESASVWASYFERRFANRLRLSRRTAANHVGLLNAPEVFEDEADMPETKWSQDTVFREFAYLAEQFLKEKVSNMQQFELALKRAPAEKYLAFYDAFQQQTQTQVPLPSPSVWHYEAEQRQQWAEKFIPISHKAHEFFTNVLSVDMKLLQDNPGKLLEKLKPVLVDVGRILIKRHERWLSGRVWGSLTEQEKDAYCTKEVQRLKRQVDEGDFDPMLEEDLDEAQSAEWQLEHDEIVKLMGSPIDGLRFSAMDFWLHTIRCEELETEHIHSDARVRALHIAARKRLLDTTQYKDVVMGMVESVVRGTLDMSAGVLRPHFNDVWCQMNYAKFGSSTITQHTTTASRQLLFFHADSLKDVAATAALYYATKPLSNSLDYASPYKYRRSLIALCSRYGVETAYTTQRPLLRASANLAQAEKLIHDVVMCAARPFGQRRRAVTRRANVEFQRRAVPVENVLVFSPASELLDCGADPSSGSTATPEAARMWPLGARRAVSYKWPVSSVGKLQALKKELSLGGVGSSLTAKKVKETEELKRCGFLEVSLWRRVHPEERERRKAVVEEEEKKVMESLRNVPALGDVLQYAASLYSRLQQEIVPSPTDSDGEKLVNEAQSSEETLKDGEWEFAVMLDDRVLLNAEECIELYLPYTDANGAELPQGEYRVHVRAFDLETNSTANPSHYSEGVSEPLQVFDAIPQLIAQFFKVEDSSGGGATCVSHIPAADFTPFCNFLRNAGLDVPLRCEFEAGQAVTTDGDVYMDYFLQLLRGDTFHQSCAQSGVTESQRAIEPLCRAHWGIYHPGATEAEWASARRSVLDHAMSQEREWWFPNDMLDVKDVVTGNTNGLTPQMYPATVRYGVELCTVLSAEGKFTDHKCSGLSARSTVNGTGAAESITFDTSQCSDTSNISVENALQVVQRALSNAQDRHNTLSAFRTGALAKHSQVLLFCGINAYEFGGKYARTYAYAHSKAKQELEATAVSGRVVSGVGDDEVERLSEVPTISQSTDRFASATHPEQRKTRFVPRVGPGATPLEDPSPDQKSLWGC
uniref:Uncharacterized protein n=1 Tax=Trypanosoma congolense (strain IL3000) TaxID=1068625 RepID=G0UPU7_TRYCI|nr:conserved hypothetical protein [Trypanosoma congolense IL3000]